MRAHLAGRKHIRYIVMRVLLTGVSGTGKSSLVRELRNRGYTAFDADDNGLTEARPDGAWGWRVDLVRALFDQHDDDLLFFAGCSDEQVQFEFGFNVLLTAPVEVVLERLGTRSTNSFGKSQDQRDRVLDDIAWVPLLRESADLVVETTSTVSKVADVVVNAVADRRRRAPVVSPEQLIRAANERGKNSGLDPLRTTVLAQTDGAGPGSRPTQSRRPENQYIITTFAAVDATQIGTYAFATA